MGHQENKYMLYSAKITLNNDNQIEKITFRWPKLGNDYCMLISEWTIMNWRWAKT